MDESNGNGLPPSLAAAWGLHVRPAKGPKPALTLDRIVEAAVRVAQADGLPAVSMSRVATEVGVTAMALYRYVGNKDELLALMVDSALGLPPVAPASGLGWREGLTEWAWAENEAYRRHPWALRVPIRGIPALPNQITWLEYGLRCFAGSGIGEEEQLSAILLISNLVRVYATLNLDLEAALAGSSADEVMASYSQMMAELVDSQRFPAISKVFASGVLAKADPVDKELAFGLERVLDGIEVLVARGRAGAPE
jgi:AcrR family transcriptional regulator